MAVPIPPELDLRPLSTNLTDAPALWTRPPAAETVDRFVAERLIQREEVDFIYKNVFRQLALITVGAGLVTTAGWTTYLLRGGARGMWTKHRDWTFVGMGIPASFFLGGLVGQWGGKMWVTEELYHRMPNSIDQNFLIYRYAQAAIPSTLPPVGSPLFDEAGQARFTFVGQQALLEGGIESVDPLPIGQEGKSVLSQLAKTTWSAAAKNLGQMTTKAGAGSGDLKVTSASPSTPDVDVEEKARSWADTWASIRGMPAKLKAGYEDLSDVRSADPLGQLTDRPGTTPITDGDPPI